MKLFFTVLVIGATLGALDVRAQGRTDKFKAVTITRKDQTTFSTSIDEEQLLRNGKLVSGDSVFGKRGLAALYSVKMDSNTYYLKPISNRKDSVAILRRAIEGKVSVYTPPFESGIEAIFIAKEASTYELRQKIVESDGKKFYKNEYRGFLQVFLSDCPAIAKSAIDKVAFSDLKIMQLVSRYNQSCGWEKVNKAKEYRAKVNVGLMVEAVHYNSTKGAYQNYFEGNRPASGFGFGLYARMDFARRKTAFLITELTFNKISGGGDITYYVNVPTYQIRSEHHVFDIEEIRNTYSAYFNIARFGKSSLALGGGILLQCQLSNDSKVTNINGTTPSTKSGDQIGLSPVVNLLFNVGRFGVGYQMVPMATQLKGYEGQHIEHKGFMQVRLSNN